MLDNTSYKLLKRFYKENRLSLEAVNAIDKNGNVSPPSKVEMLLKAGFVAYIFVISDIGENIPAALEITLDGRAYVENRRRNAAGFWLPYAITTLIALSSLIISAVEHW